MTDNVRVHELAAQLGMTIAEMMALCDVMGVGVKSHSSTVIGAQADRLRRRAERDGLVRPQQPQPNPVSPVAGHSSRADQPTVSDGNTVGSSPTQPGATDGSTATPSALTWESVGFSPAEAEGWLEAGLDDAELAAELFCADVTVDELKALTATGAPAVTAAAWLLAPQATPPDVWDHRLEWLHAQLPPDAALRWHRLGADPQQAQQLVAAGFDVELIRQSSTRGGLTVDRVVEWCRAGMPARDFPAWIDIAKGDWAAIDGWRALRLTPHKVAAWAAAGFDDPTSCAPWLEAGITSPSVSKRWSRLGFDAPTAMPWVAAGWAADKAKPWIEAGIADPIDATWWSTHRVDPHVAVGWVNANISRDDVQRWHGVGVHDPLIAAPWHNQGVSPVEAAPWIASGLTADQSVEWAKFEFEPSHARDWLTYGWSAEEADLWRAARVLSPVRARWLAERGVGRDQVAMVPELGLTATELLEFVMGGWDGDTTIMRVALRKPDAVAGWRKSRIPAKLWPKWFALVQGHWRLAMQWREQAVSVDQLAAAVSRHRLPPHELQSWIDAGRNGQQMIADFANGITDPHRATPKPAPSVEPTRPAPSPPTPTPPAPPTSSSKKAAFTKWLKAGEPWIDTAGLHYHTHAAFLRDLFDEGLKWAPLHLRLFDDWPDEDWLSEILARAEMLQDHIKRVPDYPATFDSDDLRITLYEHGKRIRAWVGRDRRGLLVSFNPVTFDVDYDHNDGDAHFAIGAAISWFLDCSVTLRATGTHPHFERGTTRSSAPSRRSGIVYVPRPSLSHAVREIAVGTHTPPVAHRVKGHVRELPDWQTPTDEARSHAPAHIRHRLKPNETFVRAHVRGGDDGQTRMTIHLSRHSSLADALGLARR